MMANMLKALIEHGRIETTVPKAKELRKHAEKMITLAKNDSVANKRRAVAKMMVRYNTLTTKEARAVKNGDTTAYNNDRNVIKKLFGEWAPMFAERNGGYTRIMRNKPRAGDNAETCIIEFVK
jgi:large subunit ribosomal protein L17